jgi:hypothetical protein
MFNDFDPMHLLGWGVEEGHNTALLLEPTYPWEADIHSEGTVLYDHAGSSGSFVYCLGGQGGATQHSSNWVFLRKFFFCGRVSTPYRINLPASDQ